MLIYQSHPFYSCHISCHYIHYNTTIECYIESFFSVICNIELLNLIEIFTTLAVLHSSRRFQLLSDIIFLQPGDVLQFFFVVCLLVVQFYWRINNTLYFSGIHSGRIFSLNIDFYVAFFQHFKYPIFFGPLLFFSLMRTQWS